MLSSQNGDRIVAVDFVTSLHPIYIYIYIQTEEVGDGEVEEEVVGVGSHGSVAENNEEHKQIADERE